MRNRPALGLALDLFRMPGLAETMRRGPIPSDILPLIRLAAGCETTQKTAATETGEAASHLSEVAAFFLQQILLHPGADCYRVLGATSKTPPELLRQHRNWLLKWLHADQASDEWDAALAYRVNLAWKEIKTGGPRRSETPASSRNARLSVAVPWISHPTAQIPNRRITRNRMALVCFAGIVGGVAVIYVPMPRVLASVCAAVGWQCSAPNAVNRVE